MVKTTFYLIDNKTHLHVGSGDSNYGVIDKLIQRDPSDGLPCIFASSLKGALREFFEENLGLKPEANDIFGRAESGGAKTIKGTHIFHDGYLLAIPLRSNARPYYSATCPMVLNRLKEMASLFNAKLDATLIAEINLLIGDGYVKENRMVVFGQKHDNLKIEDFESGDIDLKNDALPGLQKILGENIVLMHDTNFKESCNDYNLPVIARNNLENGESKNLWYEQIIPRESRFFFPVNWYKIKNEKNDDLAGNINGRFVQIGANATVGYGVCKVSADILTLQSL
jgi:CRISPR-associated protein Cmr4